MSRALLIVAASASLLGCTQRPVELFGEAGVDGGVSDAAVDADLSDRDPERCGAEEEDCEDFEYCVAGECVCRQGLTRVIERCVDTLADGLHCGMPDTPCGMVCSAGSCVATCPGGQMECLDGCVDVSRDPLHCGQCERKCGSSEVCTDGRCEVFRPAPCSTCPCAACQSEACCTYPGRPQDVICVDDERCPLTG